MYPQNERLGSIDPILRSRGLSRRIAVTVPHYLTIPAIVAKSNLIGVVPEHLAHRVARPLRLRIFEPPIALPDITIVMTWHERLQFDLAHTWFRDCVIAAATSKSLIASSGEKGPKHATSRTRSVRRRKA